MEINKNILDSVAGENQDTRPGRVQRSVCLVPLDSATLPSRCLNFLTCRVEIIMIVNLGFSNV